MASPDKAEVLNWHKYFAVETNNRAWELSYIERNDAEDHEMLSVAHASLYHWRLVGTELNQIRAKMIVAEVHALLGLGQTAWMYAQEIHQYYLTHDTPDWEMALSYAISAHAAYITQQWEEHKSYCAQAIEALEQIADPDDRDIVLKTFAQVPAPD